MNELVSKVERWIEGGIISVRTGKKILASEGIEAETVLHVRSSGKLISIISTLGAILIGLGVLLFIANNWAAMSIMAKMGTIFTGMIASYGLGYWFGYVRASYPRVGAALMLLGGIIYGAGLFLVAQFFHTNSNPSPLFLLWAAGLVPLVILLRSGSLYGLAIVIVTAWTEFSIAYDGVSGWLFGSAIPTPHYWYLLVFALLAGIGYTYRFVKVSGLLFVSMYFWLATTAVIWQLGNSTSGSVLQIMFFIYFLGLLYMLASRFLEANKEMEPFAFPMRLFGVIGVALSLYAFSFNEVLNSYQSRAQLAPAGLGTFWILILLTGVAGVAYILRARSLEHAWFAWREGVVLLMIEILGVLCYLFPVDLGGLGYSYLSSSSFHPFVLPWNAALLAFNILVIMMGYFERRNIFVNLGLFFFLIHVISRYFDVFATQLGQSFAFLAGGALLILLAVALTRFRRKLIEKMNALPTSLGSGV